MSKQEDHIKLFEQYISGEMTSVAIDSFEQKLAKDESLQIEYNDYLETIAAIKTHEFRKELTFIHKDFISSNNSNYWWLYISGIAASLAIILFSVYLFTEKQSSNLELFEKSFEKYDTYSIMRGENDQWIEAITNYSNENYKEAIPQFQDLALSSKNSDKANLLLGISYIGIGDYQKSLDVLISISDKSIYSEQAVWYIALNYLAISDSQNALSYLSKITEGQFKYTEAQALLALI